MHAGIKESADVVIIVVQAIVWRRTYDDVIN